MSPRISSARPRAAAVNCTQQERGRRDERAAPRKRKLCECAACDVVGEVLAQRGKTLAQGEPESKRERKRVERGEDAGACVERIERTTVRVVDPALREMLRELRAAEALRVRVYRAHRAVASLVRMVERPAHRRDGTRRARPARARAARRAARRGTTRARRRRSSRRPSGGSACASRRSTKANTLRAEAIREFRHSRRG